jgi:Calx-beta domain
MRAIPRIVAVVFVAGLVTMGMAPAAQAASLSVYVYGGTTAEYRKTCTSQEPFTCGTFGNVASFTIQTSGQSTPVTVSYEFRSGTAVAGQDFTGPYTGSVTIQPNFPQAWVSVPVVNDGVAEPTESLTLRVTGVSRPANIGAPDETLIFDGGNMPMDCDPARTYSSASITCTNRPAGQRWRVNSSCDRGANWNPWTRFIYVQGNEVTGNGTSAVTCPDGLLGTGPAYQPLA